MVRQVQFIAAALFTLALASFAAEAQTEAPAAKPSTIHARAKHRIVKPEEQSRQITVHKATPSWLTLGPDARVGSGAGYVLDTFDQPSAAQGTFMGYRGRERVVNQYGVPGATLFRF